MTGKGSSSEGGSVGGQRASRGGGLGWEGEQSLEEGVLGMSPHSLSLKKSQWLFSNRISDTHLWKIWKIKESNKNKEESSRLLR